MTNNQLSNEDLRAQAKDLILSFPMFTEDEAHARLKWQPSPGTISLCSMLSRWDVLLGLPVENGTLLYPQFQFEREGLGLLHPIVVSLNYVFRPSRDPWGTASWWFSANTRLLGKAPVDLLGTAEEEILLAMNESPMKQWERSQNPARFVKEYIQSMQETQQSRLSHERMWEIVKEGLADPAEKNTRGYWLYQVTAAASVLLRPDCPHELLLYAVANSQQDTWKASGTLIGTVLSRPDCTDEIRVTAALYASNDY